jgi:hypothetical protein
MSDLLLSAIPRRLQEILCDEVINWAALLSFANDPVFNWKTRASGVYVLMVLPGLWNPFDLEEYGLSGLYIGMAGGINGLLGRISVHISSTYRRRTIDKYAYQFVEQNDSPQYVVPLSLFQFPDGIERLVLYFAETLMTIMFGTWKMTEARDSNCGTGPLELDPYYGALGVGRFFGLNKSCPLAEGNQGNLSQQCRSVLIVRYFHWSIVVDLVLHSVVIVLEVEYKPGAYLALVEGFFGRILTYVSELPALHRAQRSLLLPCSHPSARELLPLSVPPP